MQSKKAIKRNIRLVPTHMRNSGFYPISEDGEYTHITKDRGIIHSGSQYPFPPQELMQYGESIEKHIESGKSDANRIQEIAEKYNWSKGNILDFACSNARVLRWLDKMTDGHEAWGVDIDANRIMWNITHLNSFHFATIQTNAHLPFSDKFFNLVYGYSIFTHLDELTFTWIAEIRRVLEKDGLFIFTLLDSEAIKSKLDRNMKNKMIHDPAFEKYHDENTCMTFSHSRSNRFHTAIKRDFICDILDKYFDILEVADETMAGTQSLIVCRQR